MHVLAWNLFFPVFFLLFLRKFFFRPVFYLENIFSQAVPRAFTLTKSQILNSSLPRGHESLFFGHGKRAPFFRQPQDFIIPRFSPFGALQGSLLSAQGKRGLRTSVILGKSPRTPAPRRDASNPPGGGKWEPVALLIGANLT